MINIELLSTYCLSSFKGGVWLFTLNKLRIVVAAQTIMTNINQMQEMQEMLDQYHPSEQLLCSLEI